MASTTAPISAIRSFYRVKSSSVPNPRRRLALPYRYSPCSLISGSPSFSSFFRGAARAEKPKNSGFRGQSLFSFSSSTENSIYGFTVKGSDGKDVSLSKFKGKVLLIVNVASQCGLTPSNYSELSHLYNKYKDRGFEVLAFPCNQFGGQEPGTVEEIKELACSRFRAEFPIFDKVDVNGPDTSPLYRHMKSNAGGVFGNIIKWNFEKFLIDSHGKVFSRYLPTTTPFHIEKDILKLLEP